MKKIWYPVLFLLLFVNTICTCFARDGKYLSNRFSPIIATTQDSASGALKMVLQKCRTLLLSDTAYATEQSYRLTDDIIYTTDAQGYLKTFSSSGYWKDLNYQSQEKNAWPPSWHLYRLMLFTRAWHKTGLQVYLQAVHKGLDYWMKNDFKCENWWHNQINIPYIYSSLMIMLEKEATPAELAFLDNVLSKRVPQNNPTGQNKIWQHDIEARIALLHKDGAAFQKAIDGMKSLIVISTNEGIQPDYSYHQHGAMLQFGNYGFHYVNSLLFWMTITAKSDFAFEEAKRKILYDYCSNGLRWTVFNQRMDLTAVGRQLRFDCDLKRGNYLNNIFNLIKSDSTLNRCRFNLLGFGNKRDYDCILEGNKSFWRSDYMVQQRNGTYMMSVKTHGNYVKKIESINSENLEGAFLNDGVCLIQNSGNEYGNIAPYWNWTMLPGTTCDTTLNPSDPIVLKTSNVSDFTGQVSDGESGISAMDYNREGIKAHKSYFFTDDLLIALGSGIEAPDLSNVVTTIDQKFNRFDVSYSPKDTPNQWIWLNNMGYIIPGDQDVKHAVTYRKGDWTKVDQVSKTKMKTDSVFSIYLGHKQHNSYAYIVKPNSELFDFKANIDSYVMKILSNTPDVQAVQNRYEIMAVFYKPGSLKISSTESIASNQPCILIYKKYGFQKVIWISDPTRKLNTIQIKIGTQSVNVNLPTGDLKGSTVKAELHY